MIVSHSRNYVFVHIHKTAGESVAQALAKRLGPADLAIGVTRARDFAAWRHGDARRGSVGKHSSASRLRTYLTPDVWDKYFKFAFVRDPIARVRSLYTYVARMAELRRRPSLRNALYGLPGMPEDPRDWPGTRIYLETSSFSEFIRHPAFGLRDPGMRPQWTSVCDEDGRLLVDFVGKFETLEADFATVLERIGLEPIPLPRRNASRSDAVEVSPDDAAHLYALYRRDFETFGYAPPEAAVA